MTIPSADARRARAAEEAAQWTVRFDTGGLSPAEHEEFAEWLHESPLHVAEMLRMSRLSSALASFDRWSDLPEAVHAPEDSVALLPVESTLRNTRRQSIARRIWVGALAAGLAIIAFSGLWMQRQLSTRHLHTDAAERYEVTLEDGSTVRLSPNTDLHVKMRPGLRSVSLDQGEAIFRVAKNPARPFVVAAAGARVQAVGTIFAVARHAEKVVVTVTEGRVAVATVAGKGAGTAELSRAAVMLEANERISVSGLRIAEQVRRIEAPNLPQWEDTQLIFEKMRVADVVAEFNRRNRLQIRLADDALGARKVSGNFDADDPRSFAEFLTTIGGASIVTRNPNEIVIKLDAAGAASQNPAH